MGAPEAAVERRVGDAVFTAHLWPVPLWPRLRFEVVTGPDGRGVWQEWLVRAAGEEVPRAAGVDGLVPWEFTVEDVARSFPGARPLEGSAPTRSRLLITSQGKQYAADFTWGLLQEVAELR
ncbi:hypothetical protein BIV57_17565 [Mangrovactinospora gilvigrisea]|uniref:Uncharacterized protein n=1 Tax=Mangrovactinospora gilvigrisea TaxID=1428644 RepID=A0A1J7BC21_9ACTN|nr:hypothetical protein BIV57_17565 [Mangrovactinospora gilvigrisea]